MATRTPAVNSPFPLPAVHDPSFTVFPFGKAQQLNAVAGPFALKASLRATGTPPESWRRRGLEHGIHLHLEYAR